MRRNERGMMLQPGTWVIYIILKRYLSQISDFSGLRARYLYLWGGASSELCSCWLLQYNTQLASTSQGEYIVHPAAHFRSVDATEFSTLSTFTINMFCTFRPSANSITCEIRAERVLKAAAVGPDYCYYVYITVTPKYRPCTQWRGPTGFCNLRGPPNRLLTVLD